MLSNLNISESLSAICDYINTQKQIGLLTLPINLVLPATMVGYGIYNYKNQLSMSLLVGAGGVVLWGATQICISYIYAPPESDDDNFNKDANSSTEAPLDML